MAFSPEKVLMRHCGDFVPLMMFWHADWCGGEISSVSVESLTERCPTLRTRGWLLISKLDAPRRSPKKAGSTAYSQLYGAHPDMEGSCYHPLKYEKITVSEPTIANLVDIHQSSAGYGGLDFRKRLYL
ncbi:hypothetical protein TWF192_002926 [Orbilia oligospora]|uniref:Uncharacterized protein n=1 Tax=Orbilia oligospora TaxID=2813651 RepID=A0A6G1MDR8_ORBOL|nr:hypothetical protein TWF191_005133 [Orbilia oligospora]KAF3254843.1 hypothetical protein TWF192_002926 [Orbilia oligospora]